MLVIPASEVELEDELEELDDEVELLDLSEDDDWLGEDVGLAATN